MPSCAACGHHTSVPFDHCPQCGTPANRANAADDATIVSDGATTGSASGPPAASAGGARPTARTRDPRGANAQERFAPGTLLLDRYRILGRVGAGGMGEVYRAEDLTLDQVVALKFLPEDFGSHDDRRRRFLQEARLARQVAHPNVCRVYDVGEVGGDLFLSMEFVEGRDLASVLRSIGRLPEEKALDIARQLCAGISALHDRSVLHRDLKPANVMLDEDGRVRITDFGLAGVNEQIEGADVRSGTPQYMAPEQLEGREVTVRSDIYSLGLVLYEVFTGKAAFQADTLEQITEMQRSATPSLISSHISEVDPAVERIVSRCLEKEPSLRPPSALVVSTALPGGDPLAAALAMGETPSPELVAASGGTGGLHPVLGIALLLASLFGIAMFAGVAGKQSLPQHLDMRRSADALEERARQLVSALGYETEPIDRYRSFARAGDLIGWVAEKDSGSTRWDRLAEYRPSPVLFWYRQSPLYLLTRDPTARVNFDDPPPIVTGMVSVVTDVDGRLVYFSAVPPESLAVDPQTPIDRGAVDDATWDRLFAAAELDRARFDESEPGWVPPIFATERRAWRGEIEGPDEAIPITIEAGSVQSRPVYFRIHGPWSRNNRTPDQAPRSNPGDFFVVLIVLAVLAAGGTLALRHLRRGRADTQSATRLAIVVLIAPVLRWLFGLHHAPLPQAMLNRFFENLALGALYALLCFVLYLALEPFVRRTWPQVLIGWTRLSSGNWRDPLVGRSVLIGGALFGYTSLVGLLLPPIRSALELPPPWPQNVNWPAMATPRALVGDVAMQLPNSLFNSLFFLMLLVLLRLLLRRGWVAYVVFAALTAAVIGFQGEHWSVSLVQGVAISLAWTYVLVRHGMLAFFTGFFLMNLVSNFPLTFDFTQMYVSGSVMLTAAIATVMLVALVAALGGRSLLRDEVD